MRLTRRRQATAPPRTSAIPDDVDLGSDRPGARSGEPRLFVGYHRVSTGRQSWTGLSFEAQRAAVRDYVSANSGRLIAEFFETASGRKDRRQEIGKALDLCRIARATLIVARLDRLSRSVEFISRLIETGVDFVATDFPYANRFTIQILAAVAEYEASLQSERMKATIAGLKARGVAFGRHKSAYVPRFPHGCQAASAIARRARSEARAMDLAPLVWRSIAEGKSYAVIAAEFNELGIAPPRNAPWSKNSIWRIVRQTASEFGGAAADLSERRTGAAQVKVARRVREIGALLLEWRRAGVSYAGMADELRGRGIPSPWGRAWGPASIQRYLRRALNVAALREGRPSR